MRYVETKTYIEHVSRLQAERAALQAELDQVLAMARGTRSVEQTKRSASIRNRLKTIDKNLAGTHDFSTFTWLSIFQMLVEAEGCEWNAEQLVLMESDLQTYEGRGEKSLRHRFGLPIEATQGSCDFPDDGEGKFLGDKADTFRVGKVGKRAYGRLYRDIIRGCKEDCMSSEQWDMLSDGEVSAGKIYHEFPADIRASLQAQLAPATVLACYQTMYLMSDTGFIRVPRRDFGEAFQLAVITQMSPKYRLRRDYVEHRLRSLAAAS